MNMLVPSSENEGNMEYSMITSFVSDFSSYDLIKSSFPEYYVINESELANKKRVLKKGEHRIYCPLCVNGVTSIVCKGCVSEGNFTYSKANGEDYKSIQHRINLQNRRIHEVEKAIQKKLNLINRAQQLREMIQNKKDRILELNENIVRAKRKTSFYKAEIIRHNDRIQFSKDINDTFLKGLESYRLKIEATNSKKEKYEEEEANINENKYEAKYSHVEQMMEFIFPIIHVTNVSVNDKATLKSLIRLAIDGSSDNMASSVFSSASFKEPNICPVFTMTDLTLPHNTEFMKSWGVPVSISLTEIDELLKPTCLTPRMDKEECIVIKMSACLSNVILLVNTLASIENIILPRYLSHADIMNHEITEIEFNDLVTRLHINIIYFCLVAGIPAKEIDDKNSLVCNLMLLIRVLPIKCKVNPIDPKELFDKFEDKLPHFISKYEFKFYKSYEDSYKYVEKELVSSFSDFINVNFN